MNVETLQAKLSSKATISNDPTTAQRWSDYNTLDIKHVIHVAEEDDVVAAVKYCVDNNLRFLVQNGGHNWTKMAGADVVINMRGLNSVVVSEDKKSVTYGGGALVNEVNDECFKQGVQVTMGICNAVGAAGSLLGGGIGRNMGKFSAAIDNLLSATMVDATGTKRTITPADEELWWAIRGAGPNFGVFTSLTIKAHPLTNEGNSWTGALIYPSNEENLEKLLDAIEKLDQTPRMCIQLFLTTPPGALEPVLMLAPWYDGKEEEAKQVYKAFYDLGPVMEQTAEMPYVRLNDAGEPFCAKGGRKPAACVGMSKLDQNGFKKVYGLFNDFVKANPPAGATTMLIESYPIDELKKKDDAVFPHRNVRYYCIMLPWYDNAHASDVEKASLRFVHEARSIWQSTSGFSENRTYINFAHGDEDLATVYGADRLEKLKALKKKYDPNGVFNRFFPIA